MTPKKRKPAPAAPVAAPVPEVPADPTLLTSTVTLRGREYVLCFDLGTLAQAEAELIKQGHAVNLLKSLPGLTIEDVMVTFAAALRRFQPEIGFTEALRIPAMGEVYLIGNAIADAWNRSLTPPEKEAPRNPPSPGR